MDWIIANKDWLFSGVGISVIGFVIFFVKKLYSPQQSAPEPSNSNINNIDIKIDNNNSSLEKNSKNTKDNARGVPKKTLIDFKNETRILFVDDDARFKVTTILTNSGWVHTKK